MIRYLLKTLGAHFTSGRVLYALTVAGVTLGVASVLGIQIINRNATTAFEGTVDAVSGPSDFSIVPTGFSIPETVVPRLLAIPGVRYVNPFVRADVYVPAFDRWLDVVGIDLLTPRGTANATGTGNSLSGANLLNGWTGITSTLAAEHDLEIGDTITATLGEQTFTLLVGDTLTFGSGDAPASSRLAFMDIAQAQHLIGERGAVTQIDIVALPGVEAAALEMALAEGVGHQGRVTTPSETKSEAGALLSAFRLNLSALSLISVLVGFFLVYTATSAALSRRRQEFGVLRSVGTGRGAILQLIAAEVGVLASLGIGLGIPAGIAVARLGLDSVSGTLTTLYLLEAVESIEVDAIVIGLAVAVGLVGAAAGALPPALSVLREHPHTLLKSHRDTSAHRPVTTKGPFAALAVAVVSAGWYAFIGHRWAPAGFVLCFALVAIMALVAPGMVRTVGRAAPIRSFGFRYAMRSMSTNVSATAVAITSLGVAVTMLVGVTLMIQSFRITTETWIGNAVSADIYVAAKSWRGRGAAGALEPSTVTRIANAPGVSSVDQMRGFRGRVNGGPVAVAGLRLVDPTNISRYPLRNGSYASVADGSADRAIISEPLARKHDLGVGDVVNLETPTGPRDIPVSGVYYDYGNEQGGIVVSWALIEETFGPGSPTAIAVNVSEQADVDAVVVHLESEFAGAPLEFRINRSIRAQAMAVFDQTFAITGLLQALALGVAAVGVTITLLVAARERIAEIALYRSLGATRLQIFRVFAGNGLNISLHGIVLGTIGGFVLGWILIEVINPASFGWTISADWSPVALIAPILTVGLASGLASVYPAMRASAVPATELTHDDT